jgi:hypothetical protein
MSSTAATRRQDRRDERAEGWRGCSRDREEARWSCRSASSARVAAHRRPPRGCAGMARKSWPRWSAPRRGQAFEDRPRFPLSAHRFGHRRLRIELARCARSTPPRRRRRNSGHGEGEAHRQRGGGETGHAAAARLSSCFNWEICFKERNALARRYGPRGFRISLGLAFGSGPMRGARRPNRSTWCRLAAPAESTS